MPQMPSIPYAAPSMYDNSRGTDRLIDLMLRSGDATARGQAASGAIWGRAVQDVGQIAAGAVQQYGEQKQAKKQVAALDAFVASDLWVKDPKAGLAESTRILGPERGVKFFEGLQSSLKLQNAQTPEQARAALPPIARAFMAAPEASRPKLWTGVSQMWQSVAGQSLGEYNPEEHDPIIKSLAAEGVTKQKTPEEIKAEAQARAEGTAAGTTVKPVQTTLDQQLAAASASGDQATISRVLAMKKQEAAATRAPEKTNDSLGLGQANFAVTGEEFLKTLPPPMRSTVRKIANYEEDITKVSSIRGDQRQKLAAAVAQYDPTFDMSQYQSRQKLRSEFTSGPAARNLTALNTAERHIATLEKAGADLPQHDIQLFNKIEGATKTALGSDALSAWNTANTKVADEVNRAFVGAGAQAQAGIQRELDDLKAAKSPAQREKSITTLRELLNGRREELKAQWERGMGKPFDLGGSITSGPSEGKATPSDVDALLKKHGF